MKQEYFDLIMNKIEFDWKLEHFDNLLWSKNNFTFSILERIINEMQADNYTKLEGYFYLLNYFN